MERARNLGLALIALSFVELAWVVFCVFGGLILGLAGFVDDEIGVVMWLGSGAYALIGLICVPIAGLHLAAGIQLRKGRGLMLALASLAASMVAMVFALYCSPFELAALIYGAIVLADGDVRRALDPG